MEYAPKSMAAGAATNVDINAEMDEVLKRIQVKIKGFWPELYNEFMCIIKSIWNIAEK